MIAHAQPRATSAAPIAAPRASRRAATASRASFAVPRRDDEREHEHPTRLPAGIVAPAALEGDAGGARDEVPAPRACAPPPTRYGSYDGRGGGGVVPIPDRIVALLPYLVPLLDGLRYSRFFFSQFPQAIVLLTPLQPIASMYFRIPFAGLISFFAIYMGMAENRTLSRFVRFNAMQAIILDICLVAGLGWWSACPAPGGSAGWGSSCTGCATTACGCSCCSRSRWPPSVPSGQTKWLPFIGEAANIAA